MIGSFIGGEFVYDSAYLYEKKCKKLENELQELEDEKYNSGSMDSVMIEEKNIHYACVYGRLDVVKKLCEDLSFIKSKSSGLWQEFILDASYYKHTDVVMFLLTIPSVCMNLNYEDIINEVSNYNIPEVLTFIKSKNTN
jgi:hypothetical protein